MHNYKEKVSVYMCVHLQLLHVVMWYTAVFVPEAEGAVHSQGCTKTMYHMTVRNNCFVISRLG